jgi:hypothetical protein
MGRLTNMPFLLCLILPQVTFGFSNSVCTVSSSHTKLYESPDALSRRGALGKFAVSSFGLVSGFILGNRAAQASGGATAGGAYLLSAKQRYNARVTKAMKAFVALEPSLEAGSFEKVKEFLTSEEDGAWKDGSSAGYLLANAFRRSSSTAPDSLPSVKVRANFRLQGMRIMKPCTNDAVEMEGFCCTS